MPMYAYKCTDCGARFETVRSVDNRYAVVCVNCNSENVVIRISAKPQVWKPVVLHNFTREPILCESKAQYKALLKEHNLSHPDF